MGELGRHLSRAEENAIEIDDRTEHGFSFTQCCNSRFLADLWQVFSDKIQQAVRKMNKQIWIIAEIF
ncbi:hypothetical protein ACO0LF_12715 [Undibacterium sp. Di27W]|uniref:hypothetical protein n=1 Tax=Undibacterium sp. Di27W TaxID=3413036 RepID=UPI003BF10B0D